MKVQYLRRRFFKFVKQFRFLFCAYEWYTSMRDIKKEEESYNNKKRKSQEIITSEIKLHNQYWHCGSFTYKRYGLAYKDLTMEEILDYVPNYYHHKKLEKDHEGIDTIKYSDKLTQCKLFIERNIPSAHTMGCYCHGVFKDVKYENAKNLSNSVADYFLKNPSGKLFFKPAGGQGGEGIYVLKQSDNGYLLSGIPLLNLEDVSSKLNPNTSYIVQECLMQSSQINRIYPGSVNTLRVIVQKQNNRMVMKTCSMRIGQNGSDVDNSCQGGICIKVDTATGKLDAQAKARFDGVTYDKHPDTGALFGGFIINNWVELKEQIENIATKLIDFNNIALDIAVTEEGAKLIEFNFRYGIEHQQCVLGGVRHLIGVYPN